MTRSRPGCGDAVNTLAIPTGLSHQAGCGAAVNTLAIPTGLSHKARGCESASYPGSSVTLVARNLGLEVTIPLGLVGVRAPSNLGQSLWDWSECDRDPQQTRMWGRGEHVGNPNGIESQSPGLRVCELPPGLSFQQTSPTATRLWQFHFRVRRGRGFCHNRVAVEFISEL